ncbi:UNVERIFIED_CONTAM: hypothetical protein PYX00_008210 [Menopon gallinae]|uniref:RNB domain-containing protein n=1 Tax=Menopon gallinae TaxID=328185 RepID=A0AAW2HM10_9NEOP
MSNVDLPATRNEINGQNSNENKADKNKFRHNARKRKEKAAQTGKKDVQCDTEEDLFSYQSSSSSHKMPLALFQRNSPSGAKVKTNEPLVSGKSSTLLAENLKVVDKENKRKQSSKLECSNADSQTRKAIFPRDLSHENKKSNSVNIDSVSQFFNNFISEDSFKCSIEMCEENESFTGNLDTLSDVEEMILSNLSEKCFIVENENDCDETANTKRKGTGNGKVSGGPRKGNKDASKRGKDSEQCDGRRRTFVNSKFNFSISDEYSNQGTSKKQKKKGGNKKKNLNSKELSDSDYPKYLNDEEMDYVSKCGLLLSGFIRINKKNFQDAYISTPDGGMDILIKGLLDRNRALEGDEVYYVVKAEKDFRISSDNEIQKTAAVVALKNEIHDRTAVGTFHEESMGKILFCPRDCRIPKIRIIDNTWVSNNLKDRNFYLNRLFRARILSWVSIYHADGEITEEIGPVGDIESETQSILLTYGLDTTPYSDSLKSDLPPMPYVMSDEEIAAREDWRKECVFTIDPPTAKDLDDAVSCKALPNGNFKIGVHISDVTHFLREGSALDEEVRSRATTVYLVQKVFHMLPRELCELCSLTPGEDKFAFSVIWEITPDATIVDHYFTRTVINSCGKFAYDQVQDVLDEKQELNFPEIHGGHSVETIAETVRILNRIAVKLREKRFSDGALRIDQTKIVFSLDENGMPEKYMVYVNKESHRLIEEFMLLANFTVAERLNSCYPDIAFLRRHAPPVQHYLERIQKMMAKYGVELDISSSKALHSSLVRCCGTDPESVAKMMVLYTLLAKPMKRATYFCADGNLDEASKWHYALNVPLYTHFTSPIRRYADVMVHRLLAASLGYMEKPNWTTEEVSQIANNCNLKKYSAKMAGEKSTELFLEMYIMKNAPLVCEAVVFDIKDRCFDCIVLDNGSFHRIYSENYNGKWTVNTEKGISTLKVVWPATKNSSEVTEVIHMFSIVKIELSKSNNKIKPKLVRKVKPRKTQQNAAAH